jgi:SAM-dependent methyltransferase
MSSDAFRSYAGKVDAYVAGRPDYPAEMLVELPDVDFAIDVGAGTGKSTELLALKARRVLAVEPVARMAERIPLDRLPNVEVAIAGAEAIPAPDESAGLILCATAFHWFDYPPATAEFFRLLAPGGTLALVWNVRDGRVPWVAKFGAVLDDYADDAPRRASGAWRRIFDDDRFVHTGSFSYPFAQLSAPSGIVDRGLSTSYIAALPDAEQDAVRRRIQRIIDEEPALAGRETVAFPYVTQLYRFRRR